MYVAAFRREDCPAGVRDAIPECECRGYRSYLTMRCQLYGTACREQLKFGPVNKTVKSLTIMGGCFDDVPQGAFSGLLVSHSDACSH